MRKRKRGYRAGEDIPYLVPRQPDYVLPTLPRYPPTLPYHKVSTPSQPQKPQPSIKPPQTRKASYVFVLPSLSPFIHVAPLRYSTNPAIVVHKVINSA